MGDIREEQMEVREEEKVELWDIRKRDGEVGETREEKVELGDIKELQRRLEDTMMQDREVEDIKEMEKVPGNLLEQDIRTRFDSNSALIVSDSFTNRWTFE